MLTINDILNVVFIFDNSGKLEQDACTAPEGIAQDEWQAGLDKAVADQFLLVIPSRNGAQYFLAGRFAVVDGDLYRILNTGAQRGNEIFINAASVTRFTHRKNGLMPAQIACFIPTASVRKAASWPEAESPEASVRASFEDCEGFQSGTVVPVSTVYCGCVGHFLVCMSQRKARTAGCPVLHIAKLSAGRLIEGRSFSHIVETFKLTGQNKMVPVSPPCRPDNDFLLAWTQEGLPVPPIPTEPKTEIPMPHKQTLVFTKTIRLQWEVSADTPAEHVEALEETGMNRVTEMVDKGFVEGGLNDNICVLYSDPEDGIEYAGSWKIDTDSERCG